MCKKYFYSVLWMFLLVSPAGYAFDVQMHKVGASMPANGLGGSSAYHIATTSSSVITSGGSYYTSGVSYYGKSASAKHSRQDYVPAVRTGYIPILYKVNAQETYQVAQFEVNAPNIPGPMRAAGLDDGEEDNGTVDENNTEDLEQFAPVGDILWGVMLLLAGLFLYTKQRKNHPTHSTCPDVSGKSIAKMNTLSKPLSILLLCLLIAPAAKADYTLTRLWMNTTGQSLTPLSPLTDINNTTSGTCGAFIVDTAGMLYIDDNSTSPQRMIRLLPNGDPHPEGNIKGCEDGNKYLWCEYDPKTNTAYWFIRNGLKNETEGFEDDMAWVKYRNITQHENPEDNDTIYNMANIYTSTAQVALSPDQYLWTASWDNAKSYCTIRRAKLTNPLDEHSILKYNQKITTASFSSNDWVYIAPIDSTRALVVNRSTNIYYCELSQQTQSLTPVKLEEYSGLTGCYSTLGGTVFQMGGKYYYTAGRSSDDNGSINYLGAFTVYKFNDAAPSNNITKTYYKKDIGFTANDNTTTCTVTFRTVVKHDDNYGDYALIYQFVPGQGVACYYYTETGKDEQRTVNISVTNGTATCNEAPVTQTKVRYFAKFQPNGETLTITWCDENSDATQTQTIVATPQQKAGYKAVFQGWNIPKEGYLTADCEITAEYTYKLEADAGQADFLDRLVTWQQISSDTAITFDLNGFYYMSDAKKVYPSNSGTRTWKINHTDVPIQETANLDPVTKQKDKTFTITIPKGAILPTDDYAYIELYHNGILIGGHAFLVPEIDNRPEAGRDLYVHRDLEITANQTAKNIYIEPTALLTIAKGATLTVTDTLYIRSRGTQVGQLLNNGTLTLGAGKLLYTHQMAQKNVAEPLAVPFNCTLPKTAGGVACVPLKTRLQAETGKESGNHVVIKKYNGAIRANGWDGTAAALWDKQSGADITLSATEGYEIVSGSAYYREYLFPLTYNKAATTEANLTAYKAANTAPHNIGWNFLCTPYTSNYSQSITLSPSDQKYAFIVRYAADGAFITSIISMGELNIPPFTPFYVQVNGTGENNQTVVLTYTGGTPAHLRAHMQAEENPTSWASITLSDGNAADQTTLIICNDHQDGYEVGADCEKMLGTTEVRPQVYTVAVDGLRAFNALPEATAATPVAVGYIAPKAAELTFSLSEDFPLEKIEHLYLSDYETGTVTDLIRHHYTFFTTAGTFQERFALYVTYRNEVSTEINSEANTADMPRKVMKDGQLYIIVQGRVLDTTGREVSDFE